jgi:hypothetical protein
MNLHFNRRESVGGSKAPLTEWPLLADCVEKVLFRV